MFGVKIKGKVDKGWLAPTRGPGKFFTLSQKPVYPFRTEDGARKVAEDWFNPEIIEKIEEQK